MVINYIDGLEDLSDYTYIYKNDSYRRGNLYYKFVLHCVECNNPYFMRLSIPTKFCSADCSRKSVITRNKIAASLKGREMSLKNRKSLAKVLNKGSVVKLNIPLYETYNHQIVLVEDTMNKNGVLFVRCTLCKEWFQPTRTSVEARAQFIKGNTDRESRFYCSDSCKLACPIYGKKKYPSGFNPRKGRNNKIYTESELRTWSLEVLDRAGGLCELCGKKAMVAHHIEPKKVAPWQALDPDNGIACCIDCHNVYGHKDDCSYIKLSNIKCD